jgi:hypothetical protein
MIAIWLPATGEETAKVHSISLLENQWMEKILLEFNRLNKIELKFDE